MRKMLTVFAVLSMATPVLGQEVGHRVGHEVGHVPLPPRRPHNIMPWVAGGLVAGALGAMYYDRRHDCWSQMVGYDDFGRKLWETVCR